MKTFCFLEGGGGGLGDYTYCINFALYSIMHTNFINFEYLTTIKLIQKTTSWLILSCEYTVFAYHVPYPYACLNFCWLVSSFFSSKIKTKLFIKSYLNHWINLIIVSANWTTVNLAQSTQQPDHTHQLMHAHTHPVSSQLTPHYIINSSRLIISF